MGIFGRNCACVDFSKIFKICHRRKFTCHDFLDFNFAFIEISSVVNQQFYILIYRKWVLIFWNTRGDIRVEIVVKAYFFREFRRCDDEGVNKLPTAHPDRKIGTYQGFKITMEGLYKT